MALASSTGRVIGVNTAVSAVVFHLVVLGTLLGVQGALKTGRLKPGYVASALIGSGSAILLACCS